jgi:histidinol dehydrogenase
MKIIQTKDKRFPALFKRFLQRGTGEAAAAVEKKVHKILADIRLQGDRALVAYTRKFDRFAATPASIRVQPEAIRKAYEDLQPQEVRSLRFAARNIKAFHKRQRVRSWFFQDKGVFLGQRISPIETVGIYVPGGKAVYPSTVLMNAVPAKVAGVRRLIMCTPTPGGEINPYLLVAADLAGVDEIYTVGGAQAVGAMAYGTSTIPRVDKIVGPGNIYVATAKKMVFGSVGIDLFAGPSEIVVLADETAIPAYAAADLLSQAEHDELAVSVLITPSVDIAERILSELRIQEKALPRDRRDVIRRSLAAHGLAFVAPDLEEAVSLVNRVAPEHLSLQVSDPEVCLSKIRHAGAIFLGHLTPQTLGDYVSGPSHVLPTGGTARFSSPLSVEDFIKRSSVICYGPEGLHREGPVAVRLARAEGLWAHARAVEVRIQEQSGESHVS